MKNPATIQQYINNFRRRLSPHMRPGVGLACNVLPSEQSGAVLEFTIGPNIANSDVFQPPSNTVNEALSKLSQRAFGGNLDGFRFAGTNVIMEDNRIIFVKGEDDDIHWSDNAAAEDVQRLLHPARRGK